MEKILVLLHTDEDGALPKAALEAVNAARGLACHNSVINSSRDLMN